MKLRHSISGALFAATAVLAVIGLFKGAAILGVIATTIELIASIATGKNSNTH